MSDRPLLFLGKQDFVGLQSCELVEFILGRPYLDIPCCLSSAQRGTPPFSLDLGVPSCPKPTQGVYLMKWAEQVPIRETEVELYLGGD